MAEAHPGNTSQAAPTHPITLAIDIGGTGLKMMTLDNDAKPMTERVRSETPVKPTPERVTEVLETLRKQMPEFDRVSVGFPGVIKQGYTLTAANLHPEWIGFNMQGELEKRWQKPVRVANDAAVQGYGAIQGTGVELVLTLGTGMGSALFTRGRLAPGLELGHHPFRKGNTYEDYLGRKGMKEIGHKKWNKLLLKAIEQTQHTFNWDHLYIGGGNAKLVSFELPKNVSLVSNQDGLLGGIKLWGDQD
ncbi:ROK family protein [Acidipila sp. EB88]|uniref:ROK family protein n=1 Tax=Acidipila sp. EB88 TaxID=2305226 RepID=UPI000F5E7C31|nr:ROK family protein [Acidipila sp. EB88]RRA49884.1 ROK family protein [Acidipila sp. EB88]